MAKQYYGCIRLTKHNPGWSDPVNDIHLLRTHRTFKCVLEEYDLRPIIRGINAGLIEFTRADIEGTSDADDGARLPMFCGNCICAAHLIKEGVLADYLADVDYQSSLEWQPPVAAEPPVVAGKANVVVEGEAEVEMKKPLLLQVSVDEVKPDVVKQEQQAVDEEGNPMVDEEGNPVMEEVEVEQHKEVTIAIEAAEGTVEPASVTFSSDPEAANYFGNGAVEVKFTAPEVTADKQIAIKFSGDGVNAKTQNVKVKFIEASDPVVFINGVKDVLMIERGQTTIDAAAITIEHGDCSADQLTTGDLTFNIVNITGADAGVAGTDGSVAGADNINITGLAMPSNWQECKVADIQITGTCADGSHVINQTIEVRVPEAKMVYDAIIIDDVSNPNADFIDDYIDALIANLNKKIESSPLTPMFDDGAFMGNWFLVIPKVIEAQLSGKNGLGGDATIEEPEKDLLIHGITYKYQYMDLSSGTSGCKIAVDITI